MTIITDDLIKMVRAGVIRPWPGHVWRWTEEDVVNLFDSLNRRWPTGEIVALEAPGPAGSWDVRGVQVRARETTHAKYIIDGWHRIASIVGAFAALPIEPFDLDFDPASSTFGRNRGLVPLSVFGDTMRFLEWSDGASREDVRAVSTAMKRIREREWSVIATSDRDNVPSIASRMKLSPPLPPWPKESA